MNQDLTAESYKKKMEKKEKNCPVQRLPFITQFKKQKNEGRKQESVKQRQQEERPTPLAQKQEAQHKESVERLLLFVYAQQR
jgi:hypothetical protein